MFSFDFEEWGYFPEYDNISFMRLGSFKNPDIELLRQKEVHGKGVKGLAIWNPPEGIDKSRNDGIKKNPFIVTGSYDGTVKVWSYNDLECLITLNHHPEGVWDVKTHKNLLASCGKEGRVGVLEYSSTPGVTNGSNR